MYLQNKVKLNKLNQFSLSPLKRTLNNLFQRNKNIFF